MLRRYASKKTRALTPWRERMASGSGAARVMATSPVARLRMQSMEPGKVTISISTPLSLNHPFFWAMAKGATAAL